MDNVATSIEQPLYTDHDPFAMLCTGSEPKYISDFDDENEETYGRPHDGDDEPFYRAKRFDCALARIAAPPPSPQEPSVLEQHFGQKLPAHLQQAARQEAAQSHASTLDRLLRRTISCSRQQSTRGVKKSYRPASVVAHRSCVMKRQTSRIPLSSRRIHARTASYKATAELADAIAMVHLSSDAEDDRKSSNGWDCGALRQRVDHCTDSLEPMHQPTMAVMNDECERCDVRTNNNNSSGNNNKRVETIIQDLREMGL